MAGRAGSGGRDGSGSPNCLVGDTLVPTARGLSSLEMLQKMAEAGDELPEVLSYDRRECRWVLRHVNGAWVAGRTNRLLEVRTDGGLAVRCTAKHYFLTHEVGWAHAAELRPGISLQGVAKGRVEGVEALVLDDAVAVYDLEVEATRNFAVTTDGPGLAHPVVVHNSGGLGREPRRVPGP